MARPEKPVDRSVPEHAALADFLRALRAASQVTYDQLASVAQLSPSTLKRAASGAGVPKLSTVLAYVMASTPPGAACDADLAQARLLWKKARYASILPRYSYHAPDPKLCATADDLRNSLRDLHLWAGRPTMRSMEGEAGGIGILPRSTAHRISLGRTLPISERQMRSYLTACEVPTHRHEDWTQALRRIRPAIERHSAHSAPLERKHAGRRGRPRRPIRAATREAHDLAAFLRHLVDEAGIRTFELSRRLRMPKPRISDYLAGRIPPHEFVVALVRAVAAPAVAERRLAHAMSLWDRAMKPSSRGSAVSRGAVVRTGSREMEVYERLTASLEQQQALRESMENAQKLAIVLMAMIGKLQVDIATFEETRFRLRDTSPSHVDLADRLRRAQEQTVRAKEELKRAQQARIRAEELALRLQEQIAVLRSELEHASGLQKRLAPFELLTGTGQDPAAPDHDDIDIDIALSRARQILNQSEAGLDHIADDLGPHRSGRAA
ncbi:helix-turn-helix domain-containing protein [Streptomyces sp. NBC_01214]|uniref:helix-turn-helix domain-containing protein n=1 Tax=Streptomyces sp. NBC_01214 TaxID=2903777 RepID=UPI00225A5C61|nr:helix-turn-helix domain-containing protein [Streptomyces sp. NBC_01214]MCX4808633.1 helix-turn-helix domain-containing protein [Streptomyces sp. NBC_01214]